MLPNVAFARARNYRKGLLLELQWLYAQASVTEAGNELRKINKVIASTRRVLRRFPITRKEILLYNPFRPLSKKASRGAAPVKKVEDPWFTKFFSDFESSSREPRPEIDKSKKPR